MKMIVNESPAVNYKVNESKVDFALILLSKIARGSVSLQRLF